ncbi:6027_t:CDS:2, partial [Funneliformis mosseae]
MYYNYFPTRKFQIYQIFSSNTNLGKTIFSTGLIRASVLKSQKYKNHYYLKPIQTGYPKDDDLRFVKTYLPEKFNSLIKLESLYKYEKAVSPHLAINNPIPKDEDVLNRIKGSISESYNESLKDGGRLFLETAGGVNSPIMSGTIQSEFYRALRLPIILVGDSNLGGISTTISSYESLTLRGYDIPTLLLFNNERYNNHLFIEKYFNENQNSSIITPKIFPISLPPPKSENDLSDVKGLEAYFDSNDEKFKAIISTLEEWHDNRFNRLDEMEEKAKEIVWWPFTQHDKVDGVNVIDSAYKDLLISYKDDSNLGETFDGSASWWTQGLGHGNSKLTLTASYAS